MKVVILGAGKRGTLLARHLIQEKRNVVILESDPKRASEVQSKLDCMVKNGSGTDPQFLKETEAHKADFFVAVTDSDEVNLVACGIVENLRSAVTTIAAIRNLTYTGTDGLPATVLGINYIVNPEAETAKSIFKIIKRGIFSDVVTFEHSNLGLYNLTISDSSIFANKSVSECRSTIAPEFVIAAISRAGEGLVPSGDTIILSDDVLSLVVSDSEKKALFRLIGQSQVKSKRIVIVGGSKIARFLLKLFEPTHHKSIVLVEKDPQACEEFAALFPNLLVIKSDIGDELIFKEERFETKDLLISLTDNDELNIITCSYAKQLGVTNTMALIRNNNYIRLAENLGIDSIISISEATVDSLLKYMRGEHVSSVHSLFGGKFEIIELEVSSEMKVSGKKISSIDMRGKGVIAGITTRKGTNIIPTGEYTIKSGDTLLICASREELDFVQKLVI
ncbi:MAG: Trk system potassium transporter TrkA [Sphaerochaetaceae bacterium]